MRFARRYQPPFRQDASRERLRPRNVAICVCSMAILFLATEAQTATINATSCSQTAVKKAVDSASPGDTVTVPAGNCAWSANDAIRPKGISLIGAGMDVNGTTITTNATRMISALSEPNHPTRVSGFRFVKGTGSGSGMVTVNLKYPSGSISGTKDRPVRLDHLYFGDQWDGSKYRFSGAIHFNSNYGLVDNCTFHDAGKEVLYVTSKDEATWTDKPGPVTFGTSEFTFIEDSTWIQTHDENACHAIMGDDSGKYVARHNKITGKLNIDAHGYCSKDANEGSTRAYEIYKNSITISNIGSNQPNVFNLRGATGFVYDNDIVIASGAGLNRMVQLYEYQMQWCVSVCKGNGPCNTYPCPQQLGWDLKAGGNRNTHTDFELTPIRVWGNKVSGGAPSLGFVTVRNGGDSCTIDTRTVSDNVKEGREYHYSADASAAPLGYVPFAYPHPIRGTAGSGGSSGSAGASGAGNAGGSGGGASGAGNVDGGGVAGTGVGSAGAAGNSSAGMGGSSGTGASGTGNSDESGCACTTPPRPAGTSWGLLSAGLLGVIISRRRKARTRTERPAP